MNAGLTASKTAGFLGKRVLPGAEWFAENAYIAPGMHRLLTATGLLGGLWGGRKLMDVVTARYASDGSDMPREQVPQMLRPIHGLMTFNPYSDAPADRWKNVLNRMAPTLGVVGAYAGSRFFFHGNKFHPQSAAVLDYFKKGSKAAVPLDVAQTGMALQQAERSRMLGAASYAFGSSTGLHWFGGLLLPFNPNVNAAAFQQAAAIKNNIPFAGWFNRTVMGNHSGGSRDIFPALRNTLKWAEANLVLRGHPREWAGSEWIARHVKDALQIFPHATPAQTERFENELRSLLESAHADASALGGSATKDAISKKVYAYLSGQNAQGIGLVGQSFEKLLLKSGFDLREVTPTHYGILTGMSRLTGSIKPERAVLARYGEHLQNDLHIPLGTTASGAAMTPAEWAASKITLAPWKAATAYGVAAGGGAIALAAGSATASQMGKRLHRTTSGALVVDSPDDAPATPQADTRWINGKPLNAMEWLSRIAITPPSLHRFMNAAYLSLALWGGMTVANVVTGRKLPLLRSGELEKSLLKKDSMHWLLTPLKPLHNLLPYTPGSGLTRDRWLQAAHYIFPVTVGAFGSYTGSYLFFRDRIKRLETPKTLEDYTDKVMMEQSKPYALLSAVTSIFNTGSGIYLLPGFNYSANMQNRYIMAAGQQVAMPGLGKFFSGNAGLTPWGVKTTLGYMSNYLARNEDARPREMPSLMHSVIGKLYPHLPDDQLLEHKQAMLNRIYEVRDTYLVNGKIPADKQPALQDAMRKILSGEGFEALLQESGLKPTDANLASNGLSGTIANILGSGHRVTNIQKEYREKFAERIASNPQRTPGSYLRSLADHSGTGGVPPHANDNATPVANTVANTEHSFAHRIKAETPTDTQQTSAMSV